MSRIFGPFIEKTRNSNVANYSLKDFLDYLSKEIIHKTFHDDKLIIALLKLSSIERIIIVFHIVLEMELVEISYLLGVSLENVYSRKYRGLNFLRKYLK